MIETKITEDQKVRVHGNGFQKYKDFIRESKLDPRLILDGLERSLPKIDGVRNAKSIPEKLISNTITRYVNGELKLSFKRNKFKDNFWIFHSLLLEKYADDCFNLNLANIPETKKNWEKLIEKRKYDISLEAVSLFYINGSWPIKEEIQQLFEKKLMSKIDLDYSKKIKMIPDRVEEIGKEIIKIKETLHEKVSLIQIKKEFKADKEDSFLNINKKIEDLSLEIISLTKSINQVSKDNDKDLESIKKSLSKEIEDLEKKTESSLKELRTKDNFHDSVDSSIKEKIENGLESISNKFEEYKKYIDENNSEVKKSSPLINNLNTDQKLTYGDLKQSNNYQRKKIENMDGLMSLLNTNLKSIGCYSSISEVLAKRILKYFQLGMIINLRGSHAFEVSRAISFSFNENFLYYPITTSSNNPLAEIKDIRNYHKIADQKILPIIIDNIQLGVFNDRLNNLKFINSDSMRVKQVIMITSNDEELFIDNRDYLLANGPVIDTDLIIIDKLTGDLNIADISDNFNLNLIVKDLPNEEIKDDSIRDFWEEEFHPIIKKINNRKIRRNVSLAFKALHSEKNKSVFAILFFDWIIAQKKINQNIFEEMKNIDLVEGNLKEVVHNKNFLINDE